MRIKVSTSASKVVSIPELLENILVHLPAKQLLLVQRVNTTWRNVINNSSELQQSLFFKPNPSEADAWYELNPLLFHALVDIVRASTPTSSLSEDLYNGLKSIIRSARHPRIAIRKNSGPRYLYSGVWCRCFDCLYRDPRDHSFSVYLCHRKKFFTNMFHKSGGKSNVTPSWRRMLITHPPFAVLFQIADNGPPEREYTASTIDELADSIIGQSLVGDEEGRS